MTNSPRTFFLLLFAGLPVIAMNAQITAGVGFDFGGLVRGGKWSELYGPSLTTAFRTEVSTTSGWMLSAQAELMYGQEVRIDPLAGLRSDVGILGDEGANASPVLIGLKSRGLRVSTLVGKQVSLGENGLSLRALVGPTFLQHNIRIQDDASLTTSNLRPDYKQGYDRRAAGVGGTAELGMQYRPTASDAVFFLALQGHAATTKPLRSVQFDLNEQAPAAGTDTGFSAKIGLIAMLFSATVQREADEIYY